MITFCNVLLITNSYIYTYYYIFDTIQLHNGFIRKVRWRNFGRGGS